MKEATELQRAILMFFNEHNIIWEHLKFNYYLIMYDMKKDIIVIGPTVKKANSYRKRLSTQGIIMRKIKDLNAAKNAVGKGKITNSIRMLQLLEQNGEVSAKLAIHGGVENPSRAVSNLKRRGYSIGAIDAPGGMIYTYDDPNPKKQII